MEKQPKLELEPSNSKRKYHRHDASVFSGGYVQHHNSGLVVKKSF